MPLLAAERSRAERGFALLIVLWTLVLLAVLITGLSATGRNEAQLASNMRGSAAAQAEADGAIYAAIFHLIDTSPAHWEPGGPPRMMRLPRGVAEVRIEPLNGRVNPNTASAELLLALLRGVGADPHVAAPLAAAIVDWRTPGTQPHPGGAKAPQYRAAGRPVAPPGSAFQSLGELGDVLGMTPDLLVRLVPHLSLYPETDPDPALADPVVRQAIVDVEGIDATSTPSGGPDDPVAVEIAAFATDASGGRANRRAVVRIGESSDGRRWRILAWDPTEG
jgi:general secretion pathway protein K